MTYVRTAILILAGLSVSACASMDTATRNAPLIDEVQQEIAAVAPSFQPVAVNVNVPRALQVSEANSYYPGGDIVWRGDVFGDRHEQVKALFETGAQLGMNGVEGALPVTIEIEVVRFHALTQKTRYSVGGVHDIDFVMTIRDAETGEIVRGPREISASLEGYGGNKALVAESKGLTQKFRITHHLGKVIRDELTLATGFVPPEGGITHRISQL